MSSRPRIAWTRADGVLQVVALLGLVASWTILVGQWGKLPASVPIHFGATGTPDAWGDKAVLVSLPSLATVLYSAITLLERFPHRYNYSWPITLENTMRQYTNLRRMILVLKSAILWMIALGLWATCETALGRSDGLGWWFLPLTLLLTLGTVGVFVARGVRLR